MCVFMLRWGCATSHRKKTHENITTVSLCLSLFLSRSLPLPLHFSPFSLAPSPLFFFFLKVQEQTNHVENRSGGGRHSYQNTCCSLHLIRSFYSSISTTTTTTTTTTTIHVIFSMCKQCTVCQGLHTLCDLKGSLHVTLWEMSLISCLLKSMSEGLFDINFEGVSHFAGRDTHQLM